MVTIPAPTLLSVFVTAIITALLERFGPPLVIPRLVNLVHRPSPAHRRRAAHLRDLEHTLSSTSAQDQFALWAKTQRALESERAAYTGEAAALLAERQAAARRIKTTIGLVVLVVHFLLWLAFRTLPMLYLPPAFVGPAPLSWIWSIGGSPPGTLSFGLWWTICRTTVRRVI
ncbi:hypothetical protein CXG81DRAFT_24375 [Caulochytrium protostelioides]|uniref:Guided entry of tail-anchored proteins 1 n=1 Tax=Caulochytrium protostelioides TaxID=1555241 RepID=A0A4V1IV64_9FUNG|nr:hypothetical protein CAUPRSCDRAFT_12448 [Caulochytrium protostelioides]RKP02969.1 hypothetical protein CXG81DRAFT_24375 [Caulochytrium protostelioides]|eukprot:RKP02969.1 hypothetical protein CXG81DRAFT_24375 [Caulochytrium protostelioides]